MALVKTVLAQGLLAAMNDISETEIDPAAAREQLANAMADVIDAYIKSGTVSTVVVGTLTPPTAVAGTGTGTIS